jgi:hypothetical protein
MSSTMNHFLSEKQIRSGLSPRFCTGVKVASSSYPLSVYMLPDQPVIQSKNLTSHSYHKYVALEANTYEYWGFDSVQECIADDKSYVALFR